MSSISIPLIGNCIAKVHTIVIRDGCVNYSWITLGFLGLRNLTDMFVNVAIKLKMRLIAEDDVHHSLGAPISNSRMPGSMHGLLILDVSVESCKLINVDS